MSYKTKDSILARVREHHMIAENLGYEVVGTFLQGSFNYGEGMSDEESDIDTKCLVLPTFKSICLNQSPTSITHICDNNEHIDIKDLRLYLNCFKKQNINFVEILFTDYMVINPKYLDVIRPLLEYREEIGRYNIKAALNCMCGMAYEKVKALEHPYPATMDKIEKYGFDGKQLSHILRLNEFMQKYLAGKPYAECLISNNAKYLLSVKRNRDIDLAEARMLAAKYSDDMKHLKDLYLTEHNVLVNKSVDDLFEEIIVKAMKINFKI